jgi:hypothetical protein
VKLLQDPAPVAGSGPAEALIKEAHERKRRRRLLVAGATAVLLLSGLGGYLASGLTNGTLASKAPRVKGHPTEALRPVVETTAFAHHGQLAFVSRGTLWVLWGSSQALREVRTPGLVPVDPSFSPDGKWLAFVASKEVVGEYGNRLMSSDLWIARANGSDARPVTAITSNMGITTTFGWDPHADLFAVSVDSSKAVSTGDATSLALVSPVGSIRTLVRNANIWSAVWSPDGSALAVSTEIRSKGYNGVAARLATYPVNGDPPTVWTEAGSEEANIIVPAGWWPIWGIGYTTVGGGGAPGGSASLDGSPFYTIARPGAKPHLLGRTLENESTGAPSVDSAGWLAFVGSTGGRTVWIGKQVVVCSPVTTECSPIPQPPETVTIDPVWSPTGSTLAYAQAPEFPESSPQPNVPSWYDAHQLYLYLPSTGTSLEQPLTPGVTDPLWSNDGKSLLYVSDNGLWLSPTLSQSPTEIVRPLFTPHDWPQYYGQVAFSSQFSWWPR